MALSNGVSSLHLAPSKAMAGCRLGHFNRKCSICYRSVIQKKIVEIVFCGILQACCATVKRDIEWLLLPSGGTVVASKSTERQK